MLLTSRAVSALILREMATSYGRSPGGFLWAVVEPVAGIALLSFALSMVIVAPPLGTSFLLYYATGLVPFLLYMDVSTKVSQSINFSRPLLGYPRITFVDAILARLIVNLLVQLFVASLVLYSILSLTTAQDWPEMSALASAVGMAAALAFGVGILNCFLLTRFPIWQRIWSILNRPLFLVSCVFFPFESVPITFQTYLWWNPIVHLTGQMRIAFYPSYTGDYVEPFFVIGLALFLSTIGMVFLRRFHRDLIDN